MLDWILIRNFRTLEHCPIDARSNMRVFIGRNGAGKSTVFDALEFLVGLRDPNRKLLEPDGGHLTKLADYLPGKRKQECLRFSVDWTVPDHYRRTRAQEIQANNPDAPRDLQKTNFLKTLTYELELEEEAVRERLLFSGVAENKQIRVLSTHYEDRKYRLFGLPKDALFLGSPIDLEKTVTLKPVQWERDQPIFFFDSARYPLAVEEAFKWIAPLCEIVDAEFRDIQRIGSARAFNESMKVSRPSAKLAPDLSNLAEVFECLLKSQPEVLDELTEELRRVIPEIRRADSRFADRYQPDLITIAFKPVHGSKDLFYTLKEMSFGTKCVLAMMVAVYAAPPKSWLCIEEPENSLHPSAQAALIKFFQGKADERRIWLATHSHIIAAESPIEMCSLITKSDGASVVESVNSDNVDRVVSELGIRVAHIFACQGLVLVEGRDDCVFYRHWSKMKGLHLDFIDTNGWTNIHYFAAVKIAMNSRFPIPVFAIADGDTNHAPEELKKLRRWFMDRRIEERLLIIPQIQLENYFIDPTILVRAFDGLDLNAVTSFLQAQSGSAKERFRAFLREFNRGPLTEEALGRLAGAFQTLPKEFAAFFDRIERTIANTTAR
jgi:predicted ATPase